MVTEEIISDIAFKTYIAGVPLYRQEMLFKEKGLQLSRQTMVNWLDKVYDQYLIPLYEMIQEDFRKLSYVHLDETTHKVIKNKATRSTSYELIGLSGRSEKTRISLYKYSKGRDRSIVDALVGKDFHGIFQTDGYQPYQSYCEHHAYAYNCGCWSHANVKFKEALNIDDVYKKICKLPKEEQLDSLKKHPYLLEFVRIKQLISRLFEIEEEITNEFSGNWDQIRQKRQELCLPIVESIMAKARKLEGVFPDKSKRGKAIGYILNQEKYLRRYLEDGRVEMTNLPAERNAKRFVLWRKNSLFSFSEGGAERMSVYMTLLMTARANHLDALSYVNISDNINRDF